LSVLTTKVLGLYSERLEDSVERVRTDIESLFDIVRGKLATLVTGPRAQDFYADLTESEQRSLVANIIGRGEDVSRLGDWKQTGEYLAFISPFTVVKMFNVSPELFFDGAVWNDPYADIAGLDSPVLSEVREELAAKFRNCLEDCAAFLRYNMPEPLTTYRSRASIDFLNTRLV
jgi:hypothetical protein